MSYKDYSTQQLRSIIVYGLDNDLVSSAEFAAERLLAETSSDDKDSVHLYGLVLLKKQRFKTAYNITANSQHIGCSFVFAKAALALEKGVEGIYALNSTQYLWEQLPDNLSSNYEFERKIIPDPAVFYNLLGKLYSQVGDFKESAINHSKALKKNPFLWDSFEELNKMGANVRVKAIYKLIPGIGSNFSLGLDEPNTSNDIVDSRDPFGDSSSSNIIPLNPKGFGKKIEHTPRSHEASPEFQTPRLRQATAPNAPTRKSRSRSGSNSGGGGVNSTSASTTSNNNVFKQPPLMTGSDTIKRGPRSTTSKVTSRLISQPLTRSTKPSAMSSTRKNINASSLDSTQKRTTRSLASATTTNDLGFKKRDYLTNEEYGEQHLLSIYSTYAKGFKAMSRYDCFKAIRILTALPEAHLQTPWVLSKLGRLHFEIVNYEESEIFFQKLRKLDNTRIEDMEYYSTLLWHLHKEVELCHLTHELLSIERNSPQTWVAIGNLFSLTREPDEAIKCFKRATQLDEKFAYAYTLQGHEYVSNDAYENALECFRLALLIEPRHYNALYGIGMVYLKLGNFTRAEFHFRKALDINPINVILICCVGMMLEKLGQREQALQQYELACKIQPLSALALFKKAQLLFSTEQFDKALIDFENLVGLAPDEASVHFLLGQLYKIFNKKNEAIKQFTIALNLDPKGSHLVKEALESI